MYHVLSELQHFSNVKYFDSIQQFKKWNWSKDEFVNLKLAKKFGKFRKGTNIHRTDFRSILDCYQNVWISGLIEEDIFICQDYGNGSWWSSKWRERLFGSEFDPSIAITNNDLYLIDENIVVKLGQHFLKKEQVQWYIDFINDKRPFDISFSKRSEMNVKLRWRTSIASGCYDVSYHTTMQK